MALSSSNSSLQGVTRPHNDTPDPATGIENTMSEPQQETELQTELVFTFFPTLPSELRNKIWKNACFLPRFIDVWRVPIGEDIFVKSVRDELADVAYTFRSYSPVPSVLHTCREARQIGLNFYQLCFESSFQTRINGFCLSVLTPACIYVNWEVDIICPMRGVSHGVLFHKAASATHNCLINFPMMRRVALTVREVTTTFGFLLRKTALRDILIYHEFMVLRRPFERQKPVLLEMEEIEGKELKKFDRNRKPWDRLLHSKVVMENALGGVEDEASIRNWGKVPVGWVAPVIKTTRMIVKKREEECDERARLA